MSLLQGNGKFTGRLGNVYHDKIMKARVSGISSSEKTWADNTSSSIELRELRIGSKGRDGDMSRYMQIDVRLLPFFGSDGFGKAFPNLVKFLRNNNRGRLVEDEPSLYHLVEALEGVTNDPAVPDRSKQAFEKTFGPIKAIRDEAREHLLAFRLKELDRCLYRLEDAFEELEKELEWAA